MNYKPSTSFTDFHVSLPKLVATTCICRDVLVDVIVPPSAESSFLELALYECLFGKPLRKFRDMRYRHRRIACLVECADGSERRSFALNAKGHIAKR